MRRPRHTALQLMLLSSLSLTAACGSETVSSTTSRVLTGTAWVPSVTGASASNHDSSVTVSKTTLTATTGPVTGLAQAWTSREISVTFDISADLGAYGSVTLMAKTTDYPSALQGGAYPVLTYLSDGTSEFINLERAAAGNCVSTGAYTCSGGTCSNNASCKPTWPSAYFDRSHWLQHQINSSFKSYATANTFPSCDWTGTTDPSSGSPYSNPKCAFNTHFFSSGKLRTGTYTAKYLLLADSYSTLSGYTAGLQVYVTKKTRAAATAGALDVNLIFVGYDVSQASRTTQGKINLDTLMTALHGFYSATAVNVKLGTISAYEWTDGEQYASLKTTDFGAMAASASAVVSSSSEGKAVNVFLVNSVTDESSLLGQAGGIGGPILNGLRNSGVVVSTFGKLDKYNKGCSAAPCALTVVDSAFADLEQTIAHEIGHYLGLNHPSESTGTTHDIVDDTPICTATDASANSVLTINSCLNTDVNVYVPTTKTCAQQCTSYSSTTGVYCPAVAECEFNYMMYWSSKYFTEGTGTGDGNLFSTSQGKIINFCSLVQ